MHYSQQLSERALVCLSHLYQPSARDLWKQRSGESFYSVATDFNLLASWAGISIHTLRRLMRSELYGIAGVVYQNTEIVHSKSKVASHDMPSAELEIAIETIEANGCVPLFTINGNLFKGKIKRKHARQQGLYISPSVATEFRSVLDNEDRTFTLVIPDGALPVLQYIFNRSNELRANHGNNWYPVFSSREISNKLDIEIDEVNARLTDLTGVLCENYMMRSAKVWLKRYSLPVSKHEDVKRMIS